MASNIATQEANIANQQKSAEIFKGKLAAVANADVERFKAIQPGLVEAIQGLGDNQLAAALAEHLPQAGGGLANLLGIGGMEALKQMVSGTPMAQALANLGIVKDSNPEDVES